MAVMAKSYSVPFYGVAESYKFVRAFPLDSSDLSTVCSAVLISPSMSTTNSMMTASPAGLSFGGGDMNIIGSTSSFESSSKQSGGGPNLMYAMEATATPEICTPAHLQATDAMEAVPGVLAPLKLMLDKHATIDYTPPEYISLLFTDLGVLTPSSVSDELIKLYC
jgi:translation initiation factor eIF-2B subunit alpha